MPSVIKEAILLLFLNVIHAHCKSILNTPNINEADSLLYALIRKDCDCGPHGYCYFETNGWKKCSCEKGYVDVYATCIECDCGPDGTCSFVNYDKTCKCKEGTQDNGGTCEVCDCGPGSSCSFEGSVKTCTCPHGKKDKEGTCTVCDCGPGSTCSFEGSIKTCICPDGQEEKEGICTDCDCGPGSACSFEGSLKVCSCPEGQEKKEEVCTECNCGPYGTCSFEYGRKKCHCRSFAVEINGVCVDVGTTSSDATTDSVEMSTIVSSTVKDCNCGENSKSCHHDWKGNKICSCSYGYADYYGYCEKCNCGPYGTCWFEYGRKKCNCSLFATEMDGVCVGTRTSTSKGTTDSIIMSTILSSTVQDCDCGENSKSCHFNWKDDKICNCIYGYVQVDGICQAICNEDKCVHGKCEVIGNGFKCSCYEGFTGRRCEEKIETKSHKQDLWKILHVSIIFAMFILLSGGFCVVTRLLSKISKK